MPAGSVSTQKAAATMLMSSSRRLETLRKSVRRVRPPAGVETRDDNLPDQLACAEPGLPVGDKEIRQRRQSARRRPRLGRAPRPASGAPADCPPMGDAVARLPPRVARFRICLAAKTFSIFRSEGYSSCQSFLDRGQCRRPADPPMPGGLRDGGQLGHALRRNEERECLELLRHVDADFRGARHQARVRMPRQRLEKTRRARSAGRSGLPPPHSRESGGGVHGRPSRSRNRSAAPTD